METLLDYFDIHDCFDKKFKEAGIDELSDIDWIMCEYAGVKRSELPLYGKFSRVVLKKILEALEKRLNHVPLAIIFGKTDFYGRSFKVSQNVLIPRMDTEILIEKSIELIKKRQLAMEKNISVLDIGTGSGAIAITLNKETKAILTAVDISVEALEIAKINAAENAAEVEFIRSDLFSGLKGRKFDLIVSNPPYIESKVVDTLQDEVKNFEPRLALDGGIDGLDYYRKIIKDAPNFLNANGKIAFEIGYNQAKAVSRLLEKDFVEIKIFKDFGGNDRVITANLEENR